MIVRKTERYYKERKKMWLKHGNWDKEQITHVIKRTTIWLLFIPIFYYEKIINHNI